MWNDGSALRVLDDTHIRIEHCVRAIDISLHDLKDQDGRTRALDSAVVPTEVARYYATYGMVALLPMQLSCTMDAFGIITRTDWLLSPAANVLLRALKTSVLTMKPMNMVSGQ